MKPLKKHEKNYEHVKESAHWILSRTHVRPKIGIVLGTGLQNLVNCVEIETELLYQDIPHFSTPTLDFHKGKLILGSFENKQVIIMQGRFHYYEGYSLHDITFPIRVMKVLGVEKLFISNASGALHPPFEKSDLVIIKDHISFLGKNPLRGKNMDEMGDRFPDMSEPYNTELIEKAIFLGKKENIPLKTGTYIYVPGPSLETPAEYKILGTMADIVGMSTVPEVIVAKHCNMDVFGISIVSDIGYGILKKVLIPEIIASVQKAEPHFIKLLQVLIRSIPS